MPKKRPQLITFNIRLTPERHKKLKEYSEKHDISMASIINNYVDSLIDGTGHVIPNDDGRKRVKWDDPLEAVRNQYKAGVDF